jgi:hypothetical protein
MRVTIPGDSYSQMKSDMHPSEYIIPNIHKSGKGADDFGPAPFPDHPAPPPRPPMPEQVRPAIAPPPRPIYDPNYSANGLMVYLHYLRNYENNQAQKLKIRCSLYEESK